MLDVLAAAVYGDVGVLLVEGNALIIEHAEGLAGTENDTAFFQVPQAAGQGFVAQLEVDDGAELGEMGHGVWLVDHAAAGGDDGIVDVQLGADGSFQSQEAVAAVGAKAAGSVQQEAPRPLPLGKILRPGRRDLCVGQVQTVYPAASTVQRGTQTESKRERKPGSRARRNNVTIRGRYAVKMSGLHPMF